MTAIAIGCYVRRHRARGEGGEARWRRMTVAVQWHTPRATSAFQSVSLREKFTVAGFHRKRERSAPSATVVGEREEETRLVEEVEARSVEAAEEKSKCDSASFA